jgi:CheY-like chemotaxis protein
MRATAAENGQSALATIRSRAVGAIACDVKMDVLDGVRLYREIEAEYPELKHRFFFISGAADDTSVAAAVKKTGRPLLRKPLDLNVFLDLVRRMDTGEARAGVPYQPFSAHEAATLRGVLKPAASLACPVCGGDLTIRGALDPTPSRDWELRCHTCHRFLIIRADADRSRGAAP